MVVLIENNNGHTYQVVKECGNYALIYCEYYDEYIVVYGIEKTLNNKVIWQQGRYFSRNKSAAENYFNEITL